MICFYVFLYFIFGIANSDGCFPSPNTDRCPAFPIGPMMETCEPIKCPTLTGNRITISTPMADCTTCTYTATATCVAPIASVRFNGAAPIFPTPQTITCDDATMQWTYNDGGIQQPITSIECICPTRTCLFNIVAGTMLVPRPYIPNDQCIYIRSLECADFTKTMINMNGYSFPTTYQVQCTGSEPPVYLFNPSNMLEVLSTAVACN